MLMSKHEAWQASCWLNELDSDLTIPMFRKQKQDFYINEPTLLLNGTICIPIRWFKCRDKTFARAWEIHPVAPEACGGGSTVATQGDIIWWLTQMTSGGSFWVGYTSFEAPPTPHASGATGWLLAAHHKKWNKHNFFLFTAAGLPWKFVHRESNIHFLSTSNIAPPLEMLDGIVDQLEDCQKGGCWAWDAEFQELVLVIPSVLAMLSDNPMQSEFACEAEEVDDEDMASDAGSLSSTDSQKPAKKRKKDESLSEMVTRIT
ncbi:hypothetical protein C8R45DRAFT_933648 [Mycena sanguinolenta]|nr:hypothetical protein C8R45DRAFT_933648 [Mycena sanguinolenta]